MKNEQMKELLYQALETEIGGQHVYQTALRCVLNSDLKEEWERYLEETEQHEEVLRRVFVKLGIDPDAETEGRKVVRHIGESLVNAMGMAQASGNREAAQLVACECVVEAETKDHLNWELIGQIAEHRTGPEAQALKEAYGEVEDQEDEHLYHSTGWARELWVDSLGLPAVLPPPEEEKEVKTAIGAARAKQSREEMLKEGKTTGRSDQDKDKPGKRRSAA